MNRKILHITLVLDKHKIVLLLVGYIVFTELLKFGAEVYLLEQSLELKLLLFSLVIMIILYKISDQVIILALVAPMFLSIFGLRTGLIVYVFLVYAFVRMIRNAVKQPSDE